MDALWYLELSIGSGVGLQSPHFLGQLTPQRSLGSVSALAAWCL